MGDRVDSALGDDANLTDADNASQNLSDNLHVSHNQHVSEGLGGASSTPPGSQVGSNDMKDEHVKDEFSVVSKTPDVSKDDDVNSTTRRKRTIKRLDSSLGSPIQPRRR